MNTSLSYLPLVPITARDQRRINANWVHNNRFEIYSLEWMNIEKAFFEGTPEKLIVFEVIWIKNGNGTLEVDGVIHALQENSIYCIPPGHVRKCRAENFVEGYYISFTTEFISLSEGHINSFSWMEKSNGYSELTTIKVGSDVAMELEIIAKKMDLEFTNYFTRRMELLKGLLNIFMIYISRNVGAPVYASAETKERELVIKFMQLLKRNFILKKMVRDYADELHITPNYLNRTVKKITGFPASHHVQQLIIIEAKRRAMYSSATMKLIAYDLGFDNLAHFSKFFKNNCGVNFTEFKKEIQNRHLA
ncbi:MAG TPA: helix-turn-helix transcriptional regulator [Flavitalea sp.]|nr:helix-turn-helix transcriptional regulator [Flavitalea sp.]